MSKYLLVLVSVLFFFCGTSFGSGVVSNVGLPFGKVLFDSAFAELEASVDIAAPVDVVIPRIIRSMTSRDFIPFSDDLQGRVMFSKRGGLFNMARYLAVFQLVEIPGGVRLGVTLSEPVQLIFFDPGVLGRKHRSVRFLKPVLMEIASLE